MEFGAKSPWKPLQKPAFWSTRLAPPCQTQLCICSYINTSLCQTGTYTILYIAFPTVSNRIPSAKPSTHSSWTGLERVPTKNADHIYHGFLAPFPTTPNDKKWWRTSHFASFSSLPTWTRVRGQIREKCHFAPLEIPLKAGTCAQHPDYWSFCPTKNTKRTWKKIRETNEMRDVVTLHPLIVTCVRIGSPDRWSDLAELEALEF